MRGGGAEAGGAVGIEVGDKMSDDEGVWGGGGGGGGGDPVRGNFSMAWGIGWEREPWR